MGRVYVFHRPGETEVEVYQKLSRYFDHKGIIESDFGERGRYIIHDKEEGIYRVEFGFTTYKTYNNGRVKNGTLELEVECGNKLPNAIERIIKEWRFKKGYHRVTKRYHPLPNLKEGMWYVHCQELERIKRKHSSRRT